MIVSAQLDCSRWHRSKKSRHLVVLDLLALLLTAETESDVAATMLIRIDLPNSSIARIGRSSIVRIRTFARSSVALPRPTGTLLIAVWI